VLIWNPTVMTVDGVIDLEPLAREGAVPSLSFKSVLREEELVFAAGWYDPDFAGVQPGVALVRIDTSHLVVDGRLFVSTATEDFAQTRCSMSRATRRSRVFPSAASWGTCCVCAEASCCHRHARCWRTPGPHRGLIMGSST
jgi:hypothetical protein